MSKETIQYIVVGRKIDHPTKGVGEVIKVTKRTITVKFKRSTSKLTYNCNDAYFYATDF
jgi:hypothetical protein